MLKAKPHRFLTIRSRGYSLIELSIVLLVVALLLTGVIGVVRTQLESRERERAAVELEQIKESILTFTTASGRLPCPDCRAGAGCPGATAVAGDGLEDFQGNLCSVWEGNVPYATLGVVADDPWRTTAARSHYQYRVSRYLRGADMVDFSDLGGALGQCPRPAMRASFNLCAVEVGNIDVRESSGIPATDVAIDQPAIVWSNGKNRNIDQLAIGGTLSNDEQENVNGDEVFVSKDFSREDATEFDDIVVWVPLNVLRVRMVATGRLP